MPENRPTRIFLHVLDNRALRRWQLIGENNLGVEGPVDISTASLLKAVVPALSGSPFSLVMHDGPNGVVERSWLAGDVPTAGVYPLRTQVTWGDGTVQHFPDPGTDELVAES